VTEDKFTVLPITIEENAAKLERLRVVRLVREAMAVKAGPYHDRRKVKALERLLDELDR
jgi:hypothetical protein